MATNTESTHCTTAVCGTRGGYAEDNTMAPNPTVWTLEVVSAKDLEAMDTGGTSDPYTIVQVAKETRKSKVIKKNLNPEWAETFELVVHDVNDTLKVSVWDKDLIDADDLKGETIIPLQDVVGKEVPQKWYTLYQESRVTGEIMLGIKLPKPEDPSEERVLIEWARPEEEDGVSAAKEKFYSQTQHHFNLESVCVPGFLKLPICTYSRSLVATLPELLTRLLTLSRCRSKLVQG
jgi:hypothetical protein